MLLFLYLLVVIHAAAINMVKHGLVQRQLPASLVLSPAQIEGMMQALQEAGAPATANVMRVPTSANQRLEIRK
jgi:hypothetical protein